MKLLIRSVLVLLAAMNLAGLCFGADASSLKPPPGAKVAVVMFEDLECPDCARAYPVVRDAAKAHNVPVVLHDFPLPVHNWSFDAAIYARYSSDLQREASIEDQNRICRERAARGEEDECDCRGKRFHLLLLAIDQLFDTTP